MKTTVKKSKKILGEKTANVAKTATEKTKKTKKTDAPKTPKIKSGKYGAPAVRYNRAVKSAPSEYGNRKWIFRLGHTVKNGVCTAFADTRENVDIVPMDKTLAEKILAATRTADKNIVNASCRYAGKSSDGKTLYLPWFAFAADNGKPEQKTA